VKLFFMPEQNRFLSNFISLTGGAAAASSLFFASSETQGHASSSARF
jgi:hypothetical protein